MAGASLTVDRRTNECVRRAGFDIPDGFMPDRNSGYYFNSTTGYYYDAISQLYYHPIMQMWYTADPITMQLNEYVDETILAPSASTVVEKNSTDTRLDAIVASASKTPSQAPATALQDDHEKVVLSLGVTGIGRGKKLAVARQTVTVFETDDDGVQKKADEVVNATTIDTLSQANKGECFPQGAQDSEQSASESNNYRIKDHVNWDDLVCFLCQRRFKSAEKLKRHVADSEMHAQNLANLLNKSSV